MRRALILSEWLYTLLLYVYPATFRRIYGSRMLQVFHDSCRATLQRRGIAGLMPLWLQTLFDLLINAYLERWNTLKEKVHSMATYSQKFPAQLWLALATTLIAFAISLLASLNLYQIEDTSSLTGAAYSALPLLRFSYDVIYLSALAAGVAICAIVGYAIVQRAILVRIGLVVVALIVAFGGFGGLIVHHAATFLVLFAVFIALMLISLLSGRVAATRSSHFPGKRSAAVFGACVGAGSMLLINVVALVLHTLLLNPVSHTLYMQGQIEGTHLNFSLIAMGLAILALIACVLSLGYVVRWQARQA